MLEENKKVKSEEIGKDIEKLIEAFEEFSWKHGKAIAGFTIGRRHNRSWSLDVVLDGHFIEEYSC